MEMVHPPFLSGAASGNGKADAPIPKRQLGYICFAVTDKQISYPGFSGNNIAKFIDDKY